MDVNITVMDELVPFDDIAGHYETYSNIILGVFPKRMIYNYCILRLRQSCYFRAYWF